MAAEELVETGTIGWDVNGKLRATRVWLVDGRPVTAKNDEELPPEGSAFPGLEELKLDSYEAVLYNPVTPSSKVTGTYTNDESGTFGGNDPLSPTFNSWSVDPRLYDQGIPFVQLNPAKWSYTDTRQNPPVDRQIVGYDEGEEVHTESRVVITKRLTLMPPFGPDQIDKIIALSNAIVKIGRTYYRFTAGPVNETAKNRWQTEYSFETDPGTPDIYQSTNTLQFPTGLQSVIVGVTFGTRTFARPPFHKVVMEPGTYDPGPPPFIGPPRFRAKPLYPVLGNDPLQGLLFYRQLPGWRD